MMSIRFRFTLLYTFILAVTLTVFGFALYTIQAQDTLDLLKQDVSLNANRLADAALETDTCQARQLDSQRGISLKAAPSLQVMGDRDAI